MILLGCLVVLGRSSNVKTPRSGVRQSEGYLQSVAISSFVLGFEGIPVFDNPVNVQSSVTPFNGRSIVRFEKESSRHHPSWGHYRAEIAHLCKFAIIRVPRQFLGPISLGFDNLAFLRSFSYPSGTASHIFNLDGKTVDVGSNFVLCARRGLRETFRYIVHDGNNPSPFFLPSSVSLFNSGYGSNNREHGDYSSQTYVPFKPSVCGLWGNDKGVWRYFYLSNSIARWGLVILLLLGGIIMACRPIDIGFGWQGVSFFIIGAAIFVVGWYIAWSSILRL